ncbi:MAG: AraC family transcriptional regulator [Hyphomicrobiales bacterium]
MPLSFVVSFLLAVILIRLASAPSGQRRANRMYLCLLGVYFIQSVLIGLRWGYGMVAFLPFLGLFASMIPPLSYLTFRDLVSERPGLRISDWPHALAPVALVALMVFWRDPIDVLLIGEFAAYGLCLLWFARHGPDGLIASRLDGSLRSFRALQAAGLALIGSALTDLAISIDLMLNGRHAPAVISIATAGVLLVLGFAVVVTGSETGEKEPAADEAEPWRAGPRDAPLAEDHEIAAALDHLMDEKQLYLDPELNLRRLARRLSVPARAVSNAVNRVHGVNISQYVNNRRVRGACRLLRETDRPVTQILFSCGFMTKSNFNREFARVTGMSPTAWRAQARTQR